MRTFKLTDFVFNEKTQKYICPYCKKEFSQNGICSHAWRMHTQDGQNFKPTLGKKGWNKGQTKETNESVAKISNTLKNKYETGQLVGTFKGKHHSDETKKKLSKSMTRYKKNHSRKQFNKNEPSLHEQRIINLICKYFSNLNYKHNYKAFYRERKGFSRCYRYDIALTDLLIDIELDGWEHFSGNRPEKDKIRDALSTKYGWIVLRLKNDKIKKMNDEEIVLILSETIKKAKLTIEERRIAYNANPYFSWKKSQEPKHKKEKFQALIQERIEIVKTCGIDFSKIGWGKKLSEFFKITPSKCIGFVEKYMPDFFKTTKHFKRNILNDKENK